MPWYQDLTGDGDAFDEANNPLLAHFEDSIDDETNVKEDELEVILEDPIQQSSEANTKASNASFSRNRPIKWPYQTLPKLPLNGVSVKPGDTVELKPDIEEQGDFLYIQHMIENVNTGDITLRGLRLRRTKFLGGVLDRKLNELCIVIQEDEDDDRDPFIQGAIEVSRHDIVRLRTLVFSEKEFPEDSWREFWALDAAKEDLRKVRDGARLVCRWVWIEKFENAARRRNLKANEGFLRRLESTECVDGKLHHSNLGKAYEPRGTRSSRSWHSTVRKAAHTYGTGFGGGGGDAEGARLAGAFVVYAWDHDPDSCESFRRAHPKAAVFQRDAASFALDPPNGESPRVTILHLSCPCDYFSPNHTCEGKNDDANTAIFMATTELLREARPIIHTQENTYGLFQRHPYYFNKLLSMITSVGYNVRWKVVNFCDYGLAANRQRLIIFASRRGYPTPTFPSKTHDLNHRRYISDAIDNIPRGASLHLGHVTPLPAPKRPYDARSALAKCITRDGGCNYHPSGKRRFTPRELACIQGFRWDYPFYGGVTQVRKQIGNAVPPLAWKPFVKQVIHTLDDYYSGKIDSLGSSVVQQAGRSQNNLQPRSAIVTPPASHLTAEAFAGHGRAHRGGVPSIDVNGLSVRTRAMSVEEDTLHGKVIMVDDSEDDVEIVGAPSEIKRSRKEVIDLT